MTSGTLFLVATPIGNLEDITLRALRTLREVDLVAAEDTRHTRKLLTAQGIHKPLVSYHEHNARTRGPRLVETLLAGKSVALVTDAGTPSVADPGFDLVRLALAQDIRVIVIPGPSAVTAALIASALPVYPFLFLGFPPAQSGARQAFFARYGRARETLVLFESPRRLGACLRDLRRIWGDRQVAVAREMTKLHEEIFRGTLEQAIRRWPGTTRGEVTLVVSGASPDEREAEGSLVERVRECLEGDPRPLREIAAEIAEERAIGKRLVYQLALEVKKGLKH
ncbi:MAG TPA: 16S rRNA (cytidine(1402)-2'-O)-methyltransferase [Syntrophobacteria bacterium]|nr:16S rRNA (cytidine(1402)-2'-O)-methyltransferase [Syntrophobacteria bacterium]